MLAKARLLEGGGPLTVLAHVANHSPSPLFLPWSHATSAAGVGQAFAVDLRPLMESSPLMDGIADPSF